MALEDNSNPFYMPVAPANGGGFGGFGGGDGWWIILLFLIFGGFGGGYGGNNANNIYPWMNQSNQISDGFRDQAMNTAINSIQNGIVGGFGDIQTALCGGFAGVNASITNAQMSALERSFAAQTANTQAITGLQAQLADCCCANRLQTVETRNTVSTEAAATRLAIETQTQQILDKLCQQEIDALKAQNVSLQNQVNMLNLAASQTAQSQYLVDKLAPAAI